MAAFKDQLNQTEADLVAEFLATKGVTKCPVAMARGSEAAPHNVEIVAARRAEEKKALKNK